MAATACSTSLAAPALSPASAVRDRADAAPTRLSLRRAGAGAACPSLSANQRASRGPLRAFRVLALAQDASFGGEAAPVEGSKLYVGNLPWNVDSGVLAEIFQEAGGVEMVEVICDRDTGRSKGFAFVVMSSPEDAKAAIDRFNGSDLGGRSLRVSVPLPPGERPQRTPGFGAGAGAGQRGPRIGGGAPREQNPNKVFVGNLSWGVDDVALGELFGDFGRVLEARVVTDRETGRSRGFGFVTLSSSEEVNEALSNLDGAELDGRQIRVSPASDKPKSF